MTSIYILNLSGDAIIEFLFTVLKNCLKCGIFQDNRKSKTLYLYLKKMAKKKTKNKKPIKNHCPVSLLPIYNKAFERILFNNMLKYFLDNNVIHSNNLELDLVITA